MDASRVFCKTLGTFYTEAQPVYLQFIQQDEETTHVVFTIANSDEDALEQGERIGRVLYSNRLMHLFERINKGVAYKWEEDKS